MKPEIKYPLKQEQSLSLDIGATGEIIFTVPDTELWLIKDLTIIRGADITVNSILIDGKDTYAYDTIDFADEYGDYLIAHHSIVVNASNSDTAASSETITVTIKGIQTAR